MSQGASGHEPSAAAVAGAAAIDPAATEAVSVVDAFSSALRAGELSNAGELLSADVVILESGGAEYSRDEYLGGHAVDDAAFLKSAHVQIKRRTARATGDMAWVATESELHASHDGKPLALRSTESMVLRRTSGAWRIVHIHWSSRPVKATTGSTS